MAWVRLKNPCLFLAVMKFEVSYKGKRLALKVNGETSGKELRGMLDAITKVEQQVTESDLRMKIVRQLKNEILQDADEDVHTAGWWEVPQELIRHKEASSFITMESDLNTSLLYERTSFVVKTMLTESGKQLLLDRDVLKKSLQKLGLQERLSQTNAVLVRIKGSSVHELKDEVEDFLRNFLQVERMKVVFEKRNYGDRSSLEIVLFGDFLLE